MTRTIEITVAADGSSTVETKGFHGPECQHASRFLELVLGQRVSTQLKPDFYRSTQTQQFAQNQRGSTRS